MGYSEDESMVRVDFFKESGKWYCAEAVKWLTYGTEEGKKGILIHEAFVEALINHLGFERPRLNGMTAICLEPYHQFSYPISIVIGGDLWKEYGQKYNQLDPAHSRWLMGLPPEWDDCAVMAMQSMSRRRKNS